MTGAKRLAQTFFLLLLQYFLKNKITLDYKYFYKAIDFYF